VQSLSLLEFDIRRNLRTVVQRRPSVYALRCRVHKRMTDVRTTELPGASPTHRTLCRNSLPALILRVLGLCKMQQFKNLSNRDREQPTSSMAISRTESTHGLTYSVAREMGVTAWQYFNSVCQFVSWLARFLYSGYSDLAHVITDGERAFVCPCHLHMACSVCLTNVQHAYSHINACVVPVCMYFFVTFCGLRLCYAYSHCGDAYVHATAPRSVCDSLRLAPQCHAFIYVVHGPILCVQTSDKTWHCTLTIVQHVQNLVLIMMFNVEVLVVA